MQYRQEIDGLRAVAVVPVVFFHAGFETFSGGFVGVDVFFVISGYLITSIILTEMAAGRFTLLRFYERRARRILPALFLVILICLPFAWQWLHPNALRDFSQSLAAVSLFSSNFLFWIKSGYFDAASELSPLLHTWSLAVEEQYYLFFPLALLAIGIGRQRVLGATLLIVALISLALAQWMTDTAPAAGFFLLPARAWELMIGALTAFALFSERSPLTAVSSSRALCEGLGLAGLLLIAYAILVFDETTPFPSFYALVPTAGTALIIAFASSQTAVGRLLGHPALVGIGLVSYSAYLWHQPLFAFARHRSLKEPEAWHFLALALLTFALAWLSWRFVETPFRRGGIVSRNTVFGLGAAVSLALIATGVAGHFANGPNAKDRTQRAELDRRIRTNYGLAPACNGETTFSAPCRTTDAPEIVVWGDSYAMHLLPGILASKPDVRIAQVTMSVCGPLFGLAPANTTYPLSWARDCLAFTRRVESWLQSTPSLRYAVLSSPFGQYIEPDWRAVTDDWTGDASIEGARAAFHATLQKLRSLGIQPVIVAPPPQTAYNIGTCLTKSAFLASDLSHCNFPAGQIEPRIRRVYDFLESFADEVPVIWLHETLCPDGVCQTHWDDILLYRDQGHLSYEGSAAIGRKLDFYGKITGNGR